MDAAPLMCPRDPAWIAAPAGAALPTAPRTDSEIQGKHAAMPAMQVEERAAGTRARDLDREAMLLASMCNLELGGHAICQPWQSELTVRFMSAT